MRELELAGHPSTDSRRPAGAGGRAKFPLSRVAFVGSVVVHAVAGYALSRHEWPSAPPQQRPLAELFLFEMPRPPQAAPETVPIPEPAVPVPEAREQPRPEPPAPAPRAAEPVEPQATVVAPIEAELPPRLRPMPSSAELAEARQRAADEVVTEGAAENEYLTFSIDDVAPPRPEPEPKPERSIFDGGGGRSVPSVATVGQQRTKFGRKVAELCNALTGGFAAVFQGFGLFSACGSPDNEPSGLFPEVRPAYLDLMPECVDTRDTAPALALEAPFSTVKCRLVKQEDPGDEP